MESMEERRRQLAVKVLEACRNQLLFEHRFLEQALFRLRIEVSEDMDFGSEGTHLFFRTDWVFQQYMENPVQVAESYLHTVIHCLYQHPFLAAARNRIYWDLAADIFTESILLKFDKGSGQTPEEILRSKVVGLIDAACGVVSVQKIFAYLQRNSMEEQMVAGMEFAGLCRLFQRDVHDLWYEAEDGTKKEDTEKKTAERERDSAQGEVLGEDAGESEQSEQDDTGREELGENTGESEKPEQDDMGRETSGEDTGGLEQSKQDGTGQEDLGKNTGGSEQAGSIGWQKWKDIAEQVLMDMQSFGNPGSGKDRGELVGDMIRRLELITRENIDYSTFLRKFACLEEKMQTNDEEFDYIFYTYGLKLYGKVPLVEPLEYKETYLVHEFIIAIDTSGSCEGELVEKFLTKTCSILQQTESFTTKVNIHVIQCDCKLQEDVKIESLAELNNYIDHLTLKGFGGTDFRPVFDYVDQMLARGEMKRVDGLFYFTDGYGIFPVKPPMYKTAFIFMEKETPVKVPPWAMKVYLNEENLT